MTEIDCCYLPRNAPRAEAEIYRGIRERVIATHCAKKERAHPCAGVITITSKHITMNCRLCGDARQVIDAEKFPTQNGGEKERDEIS